MIRATSGATSPSKSCVDGVLATVQWDAGCCAQHAWVQLDPCEVLADK